MGNEVRTILEALSSSLIPKIALGIFSGALLFTISVAAIQHVYTWTDAKPPPGVALIDVWKLGMVTGTAGTATAFLVTLFVAERNYRRSRLHLPNLSMTLIVRRVPVSKAYDAVILTLNATNTGTGLCRVKQIYWELKVLSPYDDQDVGAMLEEVTEKGTEGEAEDHLILGPDIEFPWHGRGRITMATNNEIEPNETDQFTYDFIIPEEITAVAASAWVPNADDPTQTKGWYRRTPHHARGA